MTSVGELADVLVARVNGDGPPRSLRFWGAPGGFAMVVPFEPIDNSGQPMSLRGAPVLAALSPQGAVESLWECFRRMMAEPIRDSRMLLIIVTTDSAVNHPKEQITTAIAETWSQSRYVRPDINRDELLTDKHFVAAFVYEFRKLDRREPELLKFSQKRHSVHTHLARSGINFTGLLK